MKKMHIGTNRHEHQCGPLFIDGWKDVLNESQNTSQSSKKDLFQNQIIMEEKSEEKYLGDIISNNGKNFKNMKVRQNKGQGMVSEIMSILEDIWYGKYHFEVAVLLRNACQYHVMQC